MKGACNIHRTLVARNALAVLCGVCLVIVLLGGCRKKVTVEQVEITRITVEEVRERMDRDDTITFVDSRSAAAWKAGVAKIPGAIRVPPNEINAYISEVPKGTTVIVYCT